MKKSLLAVAAIGAFASAAHAQSSVTVYGILDVGYLGGNVRTANNAAGTGTAVNTVTNTQSSGIGQNAESTSRLGFRGTEDLGGGLSAFFTVEMGLAPMSTSTIDSATTQNRQTFVGLKKNGIGSFAVGTQYTTVHNAVSATDPGQANNMMGNVIYDKAAGVTSVTQTTTNATTAVVGNQQYSGQQNNSSYAVRSNNMLSIQSEKMAGAQLNAFIIAGVGTSGNSTGNQTQVTTGGYSGGKSSNQGWGLGVNYDGVKNLMVTANIQQFVNRSPYTLTQAGNYTAATAGAATAGYFGGAAVPGVNVADTQQYYAATYDFGILKAYAQYVSRKVEDINQAQNSTTRTAQQIGVRSYITPTIESWASAGTGKNTINALTATSSTLVSTAPAGSTAASFGGFQLGSNYWLSKRTNLYAIYGQQRSSNGSFAANGSRTSYNANDYAVGVRHTF